MSIRKRLMITASGTRLRGDLMSVLGIGIVGLILLTVCGTQFGTDKDLLTIMIVGFGLLVACEGKGKKK
jgi:hypothetical protein